MNKYYKWSHLNDIYCAEVINGTTANYYKNGEVYALYKSWIERDSDKEITKEEFDKILKS